ncbi:MAG: DUF6973 domain-containing protein [Bacteriovoracaceae bacterium]
MKLTSNGGYSSVNIKIYVPESIKSAIFKPSLLVFLPTKGQRLAISSKYDENYYKDYRNRKLMDLLKTYDKKVRITDAELDLILKHPYDAYKMYKTSRKAINLMQKRYPGDPAQDNEADAFRHFIWSAYSAKEIGVERAKEFLDAHEQTSKRTKESIDMDYHNNSLGLKAGEKLKESANFDQDIIKEFERLIKDKRFRINKK